MSDRPLVVLTGCTSGLGRAAAHQIAARGAHLVLVGRSPDKLAATLAEVEAAGGTGETVVADLSLIAEVRAAGEAIRAKHDAIDVLINNAGVFMTTRELTSEGHERTFSTNHLAYHLLTNLLWDRLVAGAPARVVNTASDAHRMGAIHWDDLGLATAWGATGFKAYAQSKLMNVLFTRALALRAEGTGVTATSLHPGFVGSNFATNNGWLGEWAMWLLRPFASTPARCAEALVALALDEPAPAASGDYVEKGRVTTPAKAALSDDDAERLWEMTVALTGVDAFAAS